MSFKTQGIESLGAAVQQHNAETLAAAKADQLRTLAVDGEQDMQYQRTLANTASGDVTITLKPAADWPIGLPYHFQQVHASNSLVVEAFGSETIEGSASVTVSGLGATVSLYSDGTSIRRYSEGGSGSGVAGALLIQENLADLDDPDVGLVNLGGGASGIDVFKASTDPLARAALGVNVEWLDATIYVAAATAGATYIPVPDGFSGTVDSIIAGSSADPGGNVAVTSAIGTSGGVYTAITDGGFTVANGAAAGTKQSATPSAAKTVVGGTSLIRIAWDNGAANAFNLNVLIGITRT